MPEKKTTNANLSLLFILLIWRPASSWQLTSPAFTAPGAAGRTVRQLKRSYGKSGYILQGNKNRMTTTTATGKAPEAESRTERS